MNPGPPRGARPGHAAAARALALGLFVSLGGCAVNPVTGERELALMTESEEIQRGREYYPLALQQSGGVYRDPALEAYVGDVGRRLAAVSHRPGLAYQFRVANASTSNAYALPGGPIGIHRGLLVELENEAQLAAALAHEIGHVAARHSVRAVTRAALANLAVLGAGVAAAKAGVDVPTVLELGQITSELVLTHYSREDEVEADRLGVQYLARAGYDPLGMAQLQALFLRKAAGQAPGWLDNLFRSHPPSRERYDAVQAEVQRLRAAGAGGRLDAERFAAATRALRDTHQVYLLADEATRLEAQGASHEAEARLREAIARDSRQAPFWTMLGAMHVRRWDLQGAEEHLRRALFLDEEQFRAHYYLGVIANHRRRHGLALAALDRSLALLPTRPAAYHKALAHEALGQEEAAAASYRDVLQAGADDELARHAQRRLEPFQLRTTPWELVTVTSVSWRQHPPSHHVVHTVRVTNRSTRTVAYPRLEIEYADRKGRSLARKDALLPLTLRPGESATVPGVGAWAVPGEVHRVTLRIVAVSASR